jgi:endonuclease-8
VPEGDVVLLTARRLDAALRGRTLERAELRWPSAAEAGLAGHQVTEVVAYGKHLLTRLDDARTLRTHLRMEGEWRIARTGSVAARASGPHVRAVLANELWTCIGIDLGMLDVVRTRDEPRLLGHLGPDLLADDFERTGLPLAVVRLRAADAVGGFRRERSAEVGLPVADALLSQRGVAGIGTIYAAESLFERRLWPWTPVRAVDDLPALLLAARRLELASVATGPAAQVRFVHSRNGRPCRVCGTTVQVGSANLPPYERPVYWCPSCQRAPAAGQPTGARSSGAP